MSDVYLEVLQNYLNGSEWRQSVEMFVSSNCKYFQNIRDLDHQQHALWKTFQDIVETILGMALDSVGGSLDTLEQALDAVQNQPSRGPRDDLVKDVLERLLSFTDFEQFAEMMKKACDSAIEQERNNGGSGSTIHVDGLLRMGFRTHDIDSVLSSAPSNASLEDLVMSLSTYVSANDTGGASFDTDYRRTGGQQDAKYQYDVHSTGNSPRDYHSGPDTGTGKSSKGSHPLLKFVKECAAEGEEVDVNELNAKFVIAESILDSFDMGTRSGFGPGDAAFGLIRWAEDMKMLSHDIVMAYEEELPCVAMCFNCPQGLIEWYRALEVARLEVNQASAAGNMLSDAELHRMAELDKIAAMGTADEQLLHSLISRHDEVSQEVDRLHRECSLLVASERGVKRENLEELYLYLKQQVANGVDLDMITDELHEHVYSLVSSAKGADVINLLLDMHIYEDEQIMLKKKIQSIVGSPSKGGNGGDGGAGEDGLGGEALHYGDVDLQEVPGAGGFHHHHGAGDSKHASAGSAGAGADWTSAKGGDDSKDAAFSAMSAAQRMQHGNESAMFAADSKEEAHSRAAGGFGAGHSAGANGSFGGAGFGGGSSSGFGAGSGAQGSFTNGAQTGGDAYLSGLKEQHRTSIAQLKDLLEAEKARKLKALEDKLMRRRALQQQQQQSAQAKDSSSGADHVDAEALAAAQVQAVQEVEAEIEAVQSKYEGMSESLVSGLKKRCLNELLIAKRNHENMKSPGKQSYHPSLPLLSEDDLRGAHQRAADDLKKRFERDQKALLDSLEHERAKQRERVLKQLAARKKQASANKQGGAAAEEQEERAALNKMNIEFDSMVATALNNAQEHALLALSAIHLTEGNLSVAASRHGDDDSDYLNEDVTGSGGSLQNGRDWLQRVDEVKASYTTAAAELIQRLRVNTVTDTAIAASSATDRESSGSMEAFADVAGLMSRVITDAYDHHLLEERNAPRPSPSKSSSSKYLKKSDDSARVKAGILEEFERTKREMEENMAHAKNSSRNKLADRRTANATARNKGKDAKGDGEGTHLDDDVSADVSDGAGGADSGVTAAEAERLQRSLKLQEHMLESAVDAFLGGEPVPDIAAAYATAASEAAARQTAHRRHSAELDEAEYNKERSRIKSVHVEKEQSLLLDLQANMLEKKRVLEERLRRRRKAQGDNGDDDGEQDTDNEFAGNIAVEEAAGDVRMLEQAFEKISAHLKGLSKEQLAQLDVQGLVELMDRSARGERVALPSNSSSSASSVSSGNSGHASGGFQTNATLARPVALSTGAEDKWGGSSSSSDATFSPGALGSLPPLPSIVYGGGARAHKGEEKDSMAGEVKRISLEYNEEKQKLDLMMKIQQARQRQSLQRKLFEKSQRKAQQQQQGQSYNEDQDPDDEAQDKEYQYNSVEIGANRGLSTLKLRQPSNLQPAFKGLPAEAYQGNAGSGLGGGAGYSSTKANNQQSMALRGMNLGPMMRK